MKKHTKFLVASLTVAAIVTGACVFGNEVAKQVDIYFRNIKININGNEHTPVNEQGEAVEPFIYEGTTYLPMRAVATALGMNVEWDEETSTVLLFDDDYIKENPDTPKTEFVISDFHKSIEDKISRILPKEELDEQVLACVSGVPISAASVRYAVLASATYYDNPEDEATKQQIKQEIEDFYLTTACVVLLADKLGIDVPEEVYKNEIEDMYAELSLIYGDSFKEIVQTYTYQTPYYYLLNQYYNLLYGEIYNYFMSDEEFSNAVREATLNYMLESETEYVRAKHILICFPEEGEGENGEVTEDQKINTLNKAKEVLALVESGEDFDTLVKEYGEDPGMEHYTGGYYFTTGEMVEPFEKAAFELKEGEISDIVETNYGYHIILRLPLDHPSIKDSDLYMNLSYDMFNKKLEETYSDYEIQYADNYESRCNDFKGE